MAEILPEKERFRDEGELVYEFIDEFLVECPRCSKKAQVILAKEYEVQKIRLFDPRKLVCLNCSHVELSDGKKTIGGTALDWYFGRPLWLQISCCGNTLWAYNKRHLEFLEKYVSAKLRERVPKVNKSVASRLPNWIKSAKNREDVLKAIGKLKEKLNGKS